MGMIISGNVVVTGDLNSNRSTAQIISDPLLPTTQVIQEFPDTDGVAVDWVIVVTNNGNRKRLDQSIVWNATTNVVEDTGELKIIELGDAMTISFDAVIEDNAGTDYVRLKATVPANSGTWDIILFRELY